MSVCVVAQYPWPECRALAPHGLAGAVVLSDTRVVQGSGTVLPWLLSKQGLLTPRMVLCYTSSNVYATTQALSETGGLRSIKKCGERLKRWHQDFGGVTEALVVVPHRGSTQILELMPPLYQPVPREGIVGIGDADVLAWFQRRFEPDPSRRLGKPIPPDAMKGFSEHLGRQATFPELKYNIDQGALDLTAVFSTAIEEKLRVAGSSPVARLADVLLRNRHGAVAFLPTGASSLTRPSQRGSTMHRNLIAILVATLFLVSADVSGQEISARSASVRIGGRMHAQYSASSVSSSVNDFFLRRARLILDVMVADFFGARLQPDFAGGKTELKDAYVRLNFADDFRISMGQIKRAFDLFELSSSSDLSIIERDGRIEGVSGCTGVNGACSYSRLTEELGFAGRDQGLGVDASIGRVSFQGTMTNGTGINVADDNDAKSYSGRLTFAATSNIDVSGQYGVHDYVATGDVNEYAGAWSADVEVGPWRDGLHVQAAVASGDNWKEIDANSDAVTFIAVQGVASYYVPLGGPRLVGIEPLARLSYADPDRATTDDGAVIFTPGLMLYVQGKNRIGFNVDWLSPRTGTTELSFKSQAFLYF